MGKRRLIDTSAAHSRENERTLRQACKWHLSWPKGIRAFQLDVPGMWGSSQGGPRAPYKVSRLHGLARRRRLGERGGAGGVRPEGDEQEKREKLGLGDGTRSLYSSTATVRL